jgi:hypothetical protein
MLRLWDWSVWPSGEHLPLARRLRQSLGEHRELAEAPDCLSEVSESDDTLSLLVVAIYFLWDCWFCGDTGPVAYLSHGEVGTIGEPVGSPAHARTALAQFLE